MTAAAHKLDQIYAAMGYVPKPGACPPSLVAVRRAAVRQALIENGNVKQKAAADLGIQVSTLTKYSTASKKFVRLVACLALLLPLISFGQIKGSALLVPAAAVVGLKTNRQQWLTWDSDADSFAIRTGTNRASLSNRQVIRTNAIPVSSGSVYSIADINSSGVESAQSYWPSNRIGELWTQTSTNLTAWQDSQRLERFTNSAKQPAMFQRIVDKTVGWLPPN